MLSLGYFTTETKDENIPQREATPLEIFSTFPKRRLKEWNSQFDWQVSKKSPKTWNEFKNEWNARSLGIQQGSTHEGFSIWYMNKTSL